MYIDVFILLCVIVIVGYIVYSCIKDNFNPMVCLALVAGMFICFNFGNFLLEHLLAYLMIYILI